MPKEMVFNQNLEICSFVYVGSPISLYFYFIYETIKAVSFRNII